MKPKIPQLDIEQINCFHQEKILNQLLKTTRPTSRNESRNNQQHVLHSFRIISQQSTPRQNFNQNALFQQKNQKQVQDIFFQNTASMIKKSRKTKTETDVLLFWEQVENFGLQRQIEPPKFNKEKQTKLYNNFIKMKKEKEEKLKKEQEEILRLKRLEEERIEKQRIAQEQEKKRLLELQKQSEMFQDKNKTNRKFSFYTLVNAVMLRQLHSKPPFFRLAKLIAFQYLNLLNYKAILHKIQIQKSSRMKLSQFVEGNVEQIAQIQTLQTRLNEGLIVKRKQTNKKIMLKKNKTIEVNKEPVSFSENVAKRIRVLQACLRMKVFKLTKKNVEQKVQQVKSPRQIPSRVMALKKRLAEMDFIKANSTTPSPLSSPCSQNSNPLGLFCTLYKVTDALKNYDRIKSQKLIEKTNNYLVKKVQSLYYPMIRYMSIFYSNVVVWQIQYLDITLDKTCFVLFFKGEGKQKYFYRLDIPIGSISALNKDEIEESNYITVWPTVRDYLKSYLQAKGQMALLINPSYDSVKNYKLNFILGLSIRSRKNITQMDIDAIVETKEILNYLQTSQIVRIRKCFGSVYELLPQFQDCNLLEDNIQYIINLPLVHQIILSLRQFEQQILEYARNILKKPENLRQNYSIYIKEHKSIINQILAFRFIHNNSQFFQDQLIEDIYTLKHKSIYIQCAAINIQDIINHFDLQICNQISKFCLISLHLTLKSSFHLDDLLVNTRTLDSRIDKNKIIDFFDVDPNTFQWKFKEEYFQIKIEVQVFERDKPLESNEKQIILQDIEEIRSDRYFKPLKMNLNDFCKLGLALQETTCKIGEIQQCNFDQMIKNILFESSTYSNVADIVLRNAFTIDIKQKKLIIQPKYLHILSKTHNFIQKMDHQSLYNTIETVFKYSIYPGEQKDLIKGYQYNEKLNHTVQQLPFEKLFFDINQVDMNIEIEPNKVEKVFDYIQDVQDNWSEQTKKLSIFTKYQLFKQSYRSYYLIRYENGMKIIYMKRKKFVAALFTNNQSLINHISQCSKMNQFQKNHILTGLIKCIYQPTSFLYLKDNIVYNYLKNQLPSYHQIKVLLVSNSKKLLLFLDKVDFVFTLKLYQRQICYVHVKVYSVFKENQNPQTERKYVFYGENLFVSVELYEFNSKLKKYIILFNKFDLENFFDVPNWFDSNTVFQWCKTIISFTKFDKRFLYRVPQIINQNVSNSPISYQRKTINTFLSRQQSINLYSNENTIRCTFNEFSKNNFDQNTTEKMYFNTVHRIFRVIAHYIEKYYWITVKNKTLLVNEQQFKEQKNHKLIKFEFVIISVLAHTQLDMYQITYYFPKSKRRLMSYINILQLQEIDLQDIYIFDCINQSTTDFQNLQKITTVQKQTRKTPRVKLNMDIIQRMKFGLLRGQEQSPFSLQSPQVQIKKKSKIGFAQISHELMLKNKQIREAIATNNQISESVMKFLSFTRNLNQFEDNQKRLIEITIWQKLLSKQFILNTQQEQVINKINNLMDKLIETFEDGSSQKIRIIGKEHLLKRQSYENSRYNYKVQKDITEKFTQLIIQNQIRVNSQFKCNKTKYALTSNFKHYPIIEFLCCAQFKIERLGSAYMECFLESIKKQSLDISKPLNPITYSNSSNYNIYFRYYCLNNYFFKDVRVNLREVLNLFIADGFFKSQTNYMNSRLSLADIINMCHYLSYKIKTQNYLNLSQLALQHQEPITSLKRYIITERFDQYFSDKQLQGEGFIYSETVKKKNGHFFILQLQLFQQSKKVIVNKFDQKNDYFDQKELKFLYIESLVPIFFQLIKSKQYYSALKRLTQVLKTKQ